MKPGVGFGVLVLKEGKVLLGKRHDDPEKADSQLSGEGTWTMPGGKLVFFARNLAGIQKSWNPRKLWNGSGFL